MNFPENQTTILYINSLVDAMNSSYADLHEMEPSVSTPYIPDTKISFVLEGFYFHEHSTLYKRSSTSLGINS